MEKTGHFHCGECCGPGRWGSHPQLDGRCLAEGCEGDSWGWCPAGMSASSLPICRDLGVLFFTLYLITFSRGVMSLLQHANIIYMEWRLNLKCTHTHIYIYIHIFTYVHIYIYMYIRMYIYINASWQSVVHGILAKVHFFYLKKETLSTSEGRKNPKSHGSFPWGQGAWTELAIHAGSTGPAGGEWYFS